MDSTGLTFYDGGPYHIETSPLISRANQWTGFYMIGSSIMKKLRYIYNNFISLKSDICCGK